MKEVMYHDSKSNKINSKQVYDADRTIYRVLQKDGSHKKLKFRNANESIHTNT